MTLGVFTAFAVIRAHTAGVARQDPRIMAFGYWVSRK